VLKGVMGGGRVEVHAVANRCTNEGLQVGDGEMQCNLALGEE